MKPLPTILATPGFYLRLLTSDSSAERAVCRMMEMESNPYAEDRSSIGVFFENGDGIITLWGSGLESDIYILGGPGEGLGPPEEHRVPEGLGVYPPREAIRRGQWGNLKRINAL